MTAFVVVTSVVAAYPVAAFETTFNFDSVPSGSLANTIAKDGISFQPAAFLPNVDASGSAIPGSDSWKTDPLGDPVTVSNPEGFGRGAAPSPQNALNALFQPVLVQFSSPQLIRSFSLSLDNDRFGDPSASIGLFDAADRRLAEVSIDQTLPGSFVVAEGDWNGVSKLVLPAGAFYDNLSVSSIPEPGPATIGFLGALLLAAHRRSRR